MKRLIVKSSVDLVDWLRDSCIAGLLDWVSAGLIASHLYDVAISTHGGPRKPIDAWEPFLRAVIERDGGIYAYAVLRWQDDDLSWRRDLSAGTFTTPADALHWVSKQECVQDFKVVAVPAANF